MDTATPTVIATASTDSTDAPEEEEEVDQRMNHVDEDQNVDHEGSIQDHGIRNSTAQEGSPAPKSHTSASRYNSFIASCYPLILILVIFLLWPSGYWSMKQLSTKTDSSFHHAVNGSLSAQAQEAIIQKFPDSFDNPLLPSFLVILHSPNTSLTENAHVRETSLMLQDYLHEKVAKAWNNTNNATPFVALQVNSYYRFIQENLHLMARPFLSPDEKTTVLQVQYRMLLDDDDRDQGNTNSTLRNPSEKQVQQEIGQALHDYYTTGPPSLENGTLLEITFTGLPYFSDDLRESTNRDLHRMDTVVLPLTLFLVGVTLNWRKAYILWILPLFGMISTVALWGILTNILADRVQITQFTPSIMMSLTLGMGMDYSLFLVGRYLQASHDELSFGNHASIPEQKRRWVLQMLQQAGKVVLVSGLTLLCTFLGLVALPLAMLQSIGIGASVAIASAMMMNLLVLPAVLYTPVGSWIVMKHEEHDSNTGTGNTGNNAENSLVEPLLMAQADDLPDDGAAVPERLPTSPIESIPPPKSLWLSLSRHLLHPYKSIIIFLILFQWVILPLAANVRRLHTSNISFDSLLPQDAPSLLAYQSLLEEFGEEGSSSLAPFRLLMDGTTSQIAMDSELGFQLQQLVLREVFNVTSDGKQEHLLLSEGEGEAHAKVQGQFVKQQYGATKRLALSNTEVSVTGISVSNNVPISYSLYKTSKACSASGICPFDAMRCLDALDKRVTSQDRFATYFTVELKNTSPFSTEGVAWLDRTRQRLQALQADNQTESSSLQGVDVYVEGTAAIAHDAVQSVYHSFPWVIGITLVVVFALLGYFFGSFVPPLRSVVSISCTLSVAFGLVGWVYRDDGWFWNGTSLRSTLALTNNGDSGADLCWLVPIMSFSILVGLALDYDVFLVTRILEFRQDGYGHESSIAAGLDATGGIITAAGIIMAISFGSLLASPSPALDQWSLLLTTAVLFDTFICRSIIVPILMGWTGRCSWYPRSFDKATSIIFDGFDESTASSTIMDDEDTTGPSNRYSSSPAASDTVNPTFHS